MKKYLRILFSVVVAAALSSPVLAATSEGLQFDDQVKLANHDLRLNGLGVRAVWIFKAYVAGLYLGDKVTNGQDALNQPGPRRLQLRMLMEAGSSDIKKALIDGMRKNVNDAQWDAMQERVAQFSRTIDSIGVARVGDTINLDYVPNQGLLLSMNGVPKGSAISGKDFYNAMLAIFVGDDPVDSHMRDGLLGQ
jgi:Chalcone isomerase-like